MWKYLGHHVRETKCCSAMQHLRRRNILSSIHKTARKFIKILLTLKLGLHIYCRRRINTEEKAKVVAAVSGTEFIELQCCVQLYYTFVYSNYPIMYVALIELASFSQLVSLRVLRKTWSLKNTENVGSERRTDCVKLLENVVFVLVQWPDGAVGVEPVDRHPALRVRGVQSGKPHHHLDTCWAGLHRPR